MVIEVYKFLLNMMKNKTKIFSSELNPISNTGNTLRAKPSLAPIDNRKRTAEAVTPNMSTPDPKQPCVSPFIVQSSEATSSTSIQSKSPDKDESKSNPEDSFMIIQANEEK